MRNVKFTRQWKYIVTGYATEIDIVSSCQLWMVNFVQLRVCVSRSTRLFNIRLYLLLRSITSYLLYLEMCQSY